ncbi:MAG: UDP-2,3-diacylglucosamine diphosphatase LpxI [Candidatus Gygaella obscura]|nr:UDP-2,3-diacylglucosamine diphosphatase LpxI [Candidatus Gygaella obscura]
MSVQKRVRIGLIAGNGRFPILFAESAKNHNVDIICVAVKQETSSSIKKIVDRIFWLNIAEYLKLVDIFKSEGITRVVMAGQINPLKLFSKTATENSQLSSFLSSLKDKRADTVFGAIADLLQNNNINLQDSRMFLEDYIPKKGVLTSRQPTNSEKNDIEFGFNIAKTIGSVDIGQTVVIKNKVVVAVEAIEGSDRTIMRAGRIAGRGCIIVKTNKPNQDMRFDIPLVGLKTIKNLIRIKATCLAVEAEKTIILDKDSCVKMADKNSIAIIAL